MAERESMAAAAEGAFPPKDLHLSQSRRFLAPFPVHPAENRPQPQQKLLGKKGLGDVVVRSQAKPPQPGLVLIPGGDKEHREIPLAAQIPQQGEPVPVRQHDIQQDGVGHRLLKTGPRLLAAAGGLDAVSRLGEDLPQQPLQSGLVIHNQNGIGHGPVPPFPVHHSIFCPLFHFFPEKVRKP